MMEFCQLLLMRQDSFPGWGLVFLFIFALEAALLCWEDGALETMLVWEEMPLVFWVCLFQTFFGTSESSPNPQKSAVGGHTPPTPTVGETTEVLVR